MKAKPKAHPTDRKGFVRVRSWLQVEGEERRFSQVKPCVFMLYFPDRKVYIGYTRNLQNWLRTNKSLAFRELQLHKPIVKLIKEFGSTNIVVRVLYETEHTIVLPKVRNDYINRLKCESYNCVGKFYHHRKPLPPHRYANWSERQREMFARQPTRLRHKGTFISADVYT